MENQESFQNILFKAIYENSENELFKESFDPENLEEGWKDNLKKAAGVAAIAGGLMAGAANPAQAQTQVHQSLPDGAQQMYSDTNSSYLDIEAFAKEHGFVKTEDGYYTDEYGHKFNEHDLSELMLGYDPEGNDMMPNMYEEAVPEYKDDQNAINDEEADWLKMWKDSQLQSNDNEYFLDYIERLKNNY